MRIAKYLSVMALAAFLVALPLTATAAEPVFISVGIAPPPLPVYAQPVCPSPGYLWTPGYWGWGDDGYYWVPGTWVQPPTVGLLWTPGYWGWSGGAYLFNAGYWGPTVGFYGGINYGFGYVGTGFYGGEWRGGSFFYNSAAWHVGGGWHNTYVNNTYIHNTTIINNNHTSFNGPNGGINARPTPEQERYAHQNHPGPTAMQTQHINEAAKNPQLRLANNQGKPPIAATAKPASFSGPGVTRATNAGGKISPETLHANAANAKPGAARPGATAAGNKPEVNRGNTMANRNTNAMEHTNTAAKPEVNRGNTMANHNNAMENNRNTMASKPEVNRGNTMENRNNSMASRPPAAQPNTMRSTPPRENMARPSQPAPAEHMSQPRPAPQSHPAPMAHPAPAPHAAPHPAPAEHEGGGEKHR